MKAAWCDPAGRGFARQEDVVRPAVPLAFRVPSSVVDTTGKQLAGGVAIR